jgi:hypothetical protein
MTEIPEPTAQQILDLPMAQDNGSGATTIRGYLVALLQELWREKECFSTKRPFGDSGWHDELYGPLVKAGWVLGYIDQWGYLDSVDREQADALIAKALLGLGN